MIELARAAEVRYPSEVVGEVARFLDWLLQLNFVLLGYREYELQETKGGRAIHAVPGSGLGILSDVEKSTFANLTLLGPRTGCPRSDRGRGAPDLLEDPGVLDRPPPRPHGLHRRPHDLTRRDDRG